MDMIRVNCFPEICKLSVELTINLREVNLRSRTPRLDVCRLKEYLCARKGRDANRNRSGQLGEVNRPRKSTGA